MRTSSFILFLILLLPLLTLSSQCIPSLCPSKCCATKDTCASDSSQCNYCNPATCDSGCCLNNYCAASAQECSKSGNFAILVYLIVAIAALIPITFLMYKFGSKFTSPQISWIRRDIAPKEKVVIAIRVAPIVEVETTPKDAIEIDIKKENEEKSVQGEEMNNSEFLRHITEDKQAQEQYKEAIYHQYEDHGEKPKESEVKKIDVFSL